jgi:hypothetical protein
MAIAFDATSESNVVNTGDMSWTHTPVGTPKGVFVFVQADGGGDDPNGATYGGVAMTKIARAVDAAGETGDCTGFFLGSGIPTGAQTVTVDFPNTPNAHAVAITVTAGAGKNTQLAGTGSGTVGGDTTNPSVTITGIAGASYGAAGLFSGLNAEANVTAGSGMTIRNSHDFGSDISVVASRTSENASGNLTMAFASASDDVAMVAIAIEEVAGATNYTKTLTESATVSDAILKTGTKVLTQSVAVSEALLKTITKPLVEAATISASIIRTLSRTMTESVTISDILEKIKIIAVQLLESTGLSDSIIRSIEKLFNETPTVTDTVNKGTGRTLADSTNVSDAIKKTPGKIVSESLSLTDLITRIIGKVYVEAATFTDSIVNARTLTRILTEAVSVSAGLLKGITRLLSEALSVNDVLKKFLNGLLAIYSNKYTNRGTSSSNKYSTRSTSYSDKYNHLT